MTSKQHKTPQKWMTSHIMYFTLVQYCVCLSGLSGKQSGDRSKSFLANLHTSNNWPSGRTACKRQISLAINLEKWKWRYISISDYDQYITLQKYKSTGLERNHIVYVISVLWKVSMLLLITAFIQTQIFKIRDQTVQLSNPIRICPPSKHSL